MSRISFLTTPEFDKDFKKLLKRFRSLNEDLEVVKKAVIELFHIRCIDNSSVFEIPGCSAPGVRVYKIKKFACKSLPGKGVKSGIRVIYAYRSKELTVEFIEIYYKGDQENENRDRIRDFLNRCR